MKLAASMVIVAVVLTMPVLANAQSVSTADGLQTKSQYTASIQTATGYASQDVDPGAGRSGFDGPAREAQPNAATNDHSGVGGQSSETRRAEVTYSSYSPPIYVAR